MSSCAADRRSRSLSGRRSRPEEAGRVHRLHPVPSFKPAYLIHGDDHGRIAERRRRLRDLAESESGAQGVELFEGESATPENIATALNSLTFALGRRFIVVDGVERWTDKQVDPLAAVLGSIPPD